MKLKAALLGLTFSEYFLELGVIKLIPFDRGVKVSTPYLVVQYFSLFLDVTCHKAGLFNTHRKIFSKLCL
jgi:hypothetical protein